MSEAMTNREIADALMGVRKLLIKVGDGIVYRDGFSVAADSKHHMEIVDMRHRVTSIAEAYGARTGMLGTGVDDGQG